MKGSCDYYEAACLIEPFDECEEDFSRCPIKLKLAVFEDLFTYTRSLEKYFYAFVTTKQPTLLQFMLREYQIITKYNSFFDDNQIYLFRIIKIKEGVQYVA